MKVRIKRQFRYQADPHNVVTLDPGVHDLEERIAGLALRFGRAELVQEKKAPRKKARGAAPENKAQVAKKPGSAGSARAKPDA